MKIYVDIINLIFTFTWSIIVIQIVLVLFYLIFQTRDTELDFDKVFNYRFVLSIIFLIWYYSLYEVVL